MTCHCSSLWANELQGRRLINWTVSVGCQSVLENRCYVSDGFVVASMAGKLGSLYIHINIIIIMSNAIFICDHVAQHTVLNKQ